MKDVLIIGAGQAGLALAYYLRRANVDFALLDAEAAGGGAWRHTWDSLHCFSPHTYSSLPGWQMPRENADEYPSKNAVIDYFQRYEERYGFDIERPVVVNAIEREADALVARTNQGDRCGRLIVSATGTLGNPYIPDYEGRSSFTGVQLHSADYRSPDVFAGKNVMIVGGGNSAAQILAEVSLHAHTLWVTTKEPEFLPDDVDGRVLFDRATARIQGKASATPAGGFGDVVMVAPVREARARGVLHSVRPFTRFTEHGVVWADGHSEAIDVVIWCTGFGASLQHLQSLGVVEANGKVLVEHNQSLKEPRLWLAGYGDWTGAASATIIGAGRMAREIAPRLAEVLKRFKA